MCFFLQILTSVVVITVGVNRAVLISEGVIAVRAERGTSFKKTNVHVEVKKETIRLCFQ